MKSKTKRVILICLCIITFLLTGCGEKDTSTNYDCLHKIWMPENWKRTETENEITALGNDLPQLFIEKDTFDYDDYLHKIWIPENWEESDVGVSHDNAISFYITGVENGVIEGKIELTGIAKPEENLRSFSGTIQNGSGECHFEDESGTKGKFSLILKNKDEIEVEFEYIYVHAGETDRSRGKEILKPYNLSLQNNITIVTEQEVILDSWGNVRLAGGRFDTGRKFYGILYLTNEEGDVFYQFHAPLRTGAWVVETYTEDINGDGLTDVMLIEKFEADDIEEAEWIFIQREDGQFERGELIKE